MSNLYLNRRHILKTSLLAMAGLSALPALAYGKSSTNNAAVIPGLIPTPGDMDLVIPSSISVRLSANENPFGPSDKAKKAVIESLDRSFMYPMAEIRGLTEAIAKKENVKVENVLISAGSSQILLAAFLAYGNKGKFLVADPGYISRMGEIDMEKVPLNKEHQHDLGEMEKRVNSETSMVYICNPNNPTGTIVNPKQLASFCDAVSPKVPVMVDEAYIDYTDAPQDNTMMDAVRKGQNVIVVRTFSKLHGLAGLRVGYCIAQPEMIEVLEKYLSRFDMSMTSGAAALASYSDAEFLTLAKEKTMASKKFTYDTLKAMDYEYVPSHANFVLFPLRMKGDTFLKKMQEEGVSVRSWEFNRQHWCRVSMGKMEDVQVFAQSFKKVVS